MSLRISEDGAPHEAPAARRGLGGLAADVGEAGALGPAATQPAPDVRSTGDTDLPATIPAAAGVDLSPSLGELAFVIGLALLAGYLFRDRSGEQVEQQFNEKE